MKFVRFMWYPDDVFHYMFKAELVTLVSLKSSVGLLVLPQKFLIL